MDSDLSSIGFSTVYSQGRISDYAGASEFLPAPSAENSSIPPGPFPKNNKVFVNSREGEMPGDLHRHK